jgi:hypothetical protein
MIHSTTASSVRARWLVAVAALVLSTSGTARAQSSAGEATLAEALFREGRTLMQEQRYAEACAKFAESQRLDPAGGTLINLALCHEAQGKLATAWGEFREALAKARAEERADRLTVATERLAALEPLLPKLSIFVAPAAAEGELVVSVDGVPLRRAAWGVAVPVDPGSHLVKASAPGREDFSISVELAVKESKRIEITPLPRSQKTGPGPAKSAAPPAEREGDDGQATTGLIVGGLGLAALGIGGFFGIQAINRRAESDDECPTDSTCSDEGVRLNDSALQAAWFANIGIGLGVLGVGAGTYLLITAENDEAGPSAKAPTAASITVRGAF